MTIKEANKKIYSLVNPFTYINITKNGVDIDGIITIEQLEKIINVLKEIK